MESTRSGVLCAAQNGPENFKAGDESSNEWYVHEQDSGEGSPCDYTKASYDFLVKQMKSGG